MIEYNKELSYKDLCQLFNLTPNPNGHARELQLSQLQKLYDIEKLKDKRGKYIVHRELSKEEKEYLAGLSDYSNYVYNILLNFFSENCLAKSIFTVRELRERISLVNDKYYPFKYGKKDIEIKIPSNYSGDILQVEKEWIDISDDMDEHLLNYNIEKMQKNGLIEYYRSYVFYKIPANSDATTYYPPHPLTDDELADFIEFQAQTIKELGLESKQDLYKRINGALLKSYRSKMMRYIMNKGYTNYAKAYVIIKPKGLETLKDYYSLEFNRLRVQKCITSKRYKTIPPFIHEAMVNELIKIN